MDSRRLRQGARSRGRLSAPPLAGVALSILVLALGGCLPRAAAQPRLPVALSEDHVEPELVTVHHKVAPGQTLYRIARAYGVSTADLMEVNGIQDPRTLTVGQELVIPGASEPVDVPPTEPAAMIPPPPSRGSADDPDEPTRDGPPVLKRRSTRPAKVVMAPKEPGPSREEETPGPSAAPAEEETPAARLERALARTATPPPDVAAAKNAPAAKESPAATASKPARVDPPGTRVARADPVPVPTPASQAAEAKPAPGHPGLLEWPLRGVLYARFGKKGKEPHDGIDLAAPAGTPVRTAAEGTVLFAGEQKGYGLIAIVEHERGLITLYAHNRDLRVKTGQKVRGGQVIATVGESGKTSGPHLHFEVRKEGIPVDPLEVLGPVPPR